jgi:hypothetical protein
MPIIKYHHSVEIGDLFYVAAGVTVNEGDVMVLTGNTKTTDPTGTKYEVAPMINPYATTAVIGIALTDMEATFINRDDITILIHGPAEVVAGGAGATINNMVKGVVGECTVENASAGEWAVGRALETAASGSKVIIMVDVGQI